MFLININNAISAPSEFPSVEDALYFGPIFAITLIVLYTLFRIFFLNKNLFPLGLRGSAPLFTGITIVHGAMGPLAIYGFAINHL